MARISISRAGAMQEIRNGAARLFPGRSALPEIQGFASGQSGLRSQAIMRNKQRGVSFLVVFLIGVLLALVAVGAMKVAPAYMEFATVKKDINAVAANEGRNASVAAIRTAFDKRADIDDIKAVTGADLDITKDGGDVVISFAYTQKIPLFANVSLLIDFSASSAP